MHIDALIAPNGKSMFCVNWSHLIKTYGKRIFIEPSYVDQIFCVTFCNIGGLCCSPKHGIYVHKPVQVIDDKVGHRNVWFDIGQNQPCKTKNNNQWACQV